jgi:hypothetical protein
MALGVNWEETAGDADAIVADLAGRTGTQIVFHTATIACALLVLVFAAGLKRRLDAQAPAGSLLPTVAVWGLVLVFAAGLKRRLDAQAPAGSLLPTVAGWGLVLVSVAGLLGSGLDTQFLFGLGDTALIVPESGAFYSDWVATIPWLWVGAGVAGVALGVAALRHAAAPRWIGVVGFVLGGLALLTGVSPLQYMAGFVGPIWLLVTALGFALGDRR